MSKDVKLALNVKPRIEWLDIAKGLGVLLVFIGHFWYKCSFPIVNQIIYSFHMPMFFVLSGFIFKKSNLKFELFVVSKIKRLLLPTFIFFLLGTSVLFLFSKNSYIAILKEFLFLEGMCPFNDPCWYFITLFQLLIISYFLNLDKLPFLCKSFIIIISFILGFILYEFNIFIPFGINRTIISLVFFSVGSILGQAHREGTGILKPYSKVLIIGCLMLWIFCGVILNRKVSFYYMSIGNYFYFIIAGVCGSALFIELSKQLQKAKRIKRFLIKTADNSILIIGTHYFVKVVFEKIMSRFGLFGTWQYCLIVLCFSFVTILIYNYIGAFFKKHLPAITGDMR